MTDVADTAIGAAPPTSLPARPGEASQPGHDAARAALERFRARLGENFYLSNPELRHTVAFHLGDRLDSELASHGAAVAEAEPQTTSASTTRGSSPTTVSAGGSTGSIITGTTRRSAM
jgi:hypothetical protein